MRISYEKQDAHMYRREFNPVNVPFEIDVIWLYCKSLQLIVTYEQEWQFGKLNRSINQDPHKDNEKCTPPNNCTFIVKKELDLHNYTLTSKQEKSVL